MKTAEKIYSYSVFYEAAPEGGYAVFVPSLPGCHTQGETLEEAEKNIREAIELYLESLADHKETIPEEIKSFRPYRSKLLNLSAEALAEAENLTENTCPVKFVQQICAGNHIFGKRKLFHKIFD